MTDAPGPTGIEEKEKGRDRRRYHKGEEGLHAEVNLDIGCSHSHLHAVDLGDGWIECGGKDTAKDTGE
jgi:hypothetical protein